MCPIQYLLCYRINEFVSFLLGPFSVQVLLQCIFKAQVINSANALILTAVRKDRDKDNETDNYNETDNDKYI